MAIDKAVDSSQLDSGLTNLANAIRAKSGTNEQFSFPDGMAQAIIAFPSGGTGGIEKTLLGTVTSPSANNNATDLVTIDYGDLDFNTFIFARSDGSEYGNIAFFDPEVHIERPSVSGIRFGVQDIYPIGFAQAQMFYVQMREYEDYENHIISIGYNRVSGGYNAGFSETFNIYACKLPEQILGV